MSGSLKTVVTAVSVTCLIYLGLLALFVFPSDQVGLVRLGYILDDLACNRDQPSWLPPCYSSSALPLARAAVSFRSSDIVANSYYDGVAVAEDSRSDEESIVDRVGRGDIVAVYSDVILGAAAAAKLGRYDVARRIVDRFPSFPYRARVKAADLFRLDQLQEAYRTGRLSRSELQRVRLEIDSRSPVTNLPMTAADRYAFVGEEAYFILRDARVARWLFAESVHLEPENRAAYYLSRLNSESHVTPLDMISALHSRV